MNFRTDPGFVRFLFLSGLLVAAPENGAALLKPNRNCPPSRTRNNKSATNSPRKVDDLLAVGEFRRSHRTRQKGPWSLTSEIHGD